MNNRDELIRIAYNTLDIINKGSYINLLGKQVNLQSTLDSAVRQSVLYKPHELEDLIIQATHELSRHPKGVPSISISEESTLEASKRLRQKYQHVACLNFASAKNPGGGFLSGSRAQEESLARASGLYPCLKQMSEMYEANRRNHSALYLDYFIYSPSVPVFRADNGNLLDTPYDVSIITMPAVNAGVVSQREPDSIDLIEQVMKNRIRAILSAGIIHQEEAIVLGAFGCGVFQNSPYKIANYFKQILQKENYQYGYKEIVFAVYDKTLRKEAYHAFCDIIGSKL